MLRLLRAVGWKPQAPSWPSNEPSIGSMSVFSPALRGAVAVALGTGLLAVGCGGSEGDGASSNTPTVKAPAKAPNVIVILTDDQDVASLGVMRHVQGEIAKNGTTFTNSFATVPECCPSRVTLLTGQFAHNHGVLSNEPPDGGFDAFHDDNYLPLWLQQAGYRTGYVGK